METHEGRLPIRLYHGTSTIFLDGITQSGLGGRNPLSEWKILEFAKLIYPLVREHFSKEPSWMAKAQSFGFMVEQKSAAMNFQHGDTYLSPSSATAVRYAVNKKFGSELLSYTLDFLDELLRRKVSGVRDELYQEYSHIYDLLNISCVPLLISVDGVSTNHLSAENGGDAAQALTDVFTTLRDNNKRDAEILLQQTNFRLRQPVPASKLKIWMINVTRWSPHFPDYSLHMLSVPDEGHVA